jgi:hypothetical protein
MRAGGEEDLSHFVGACRGRVHARSITCRFCSSSCLANRARSTIADATPKNRLARQAVEAAYRPQSIGTVTVCPPIHRGRHLRLHYHVRARLAQQPWTNTSAVRAARTSFNRPRTQPEFSLEVVGGHEILRKAAPGAATPINRLFRRDVRKPTSSDASHGIHGPSESRLATDLGPSFRYSRGD